ncbi:hypothetical protein SETIT_7G325500v2 [Setaria italica]|uniref:Uncharacterized protein n=1 Tax=Setaria italica TaxID=4555 RepID=A0A368S2F5_SETIT|nr:uncharacterized protein LOC101782771 [Setaria italica]RCV36523.1 hypothetical protein SETIT_7G325500v2 [Setaria italica]
MAASRAGDPPESSRLRMGDDIAWSEINGVYDRDDSLKENTNPKCLLKNHPHHNNGSSQRFSGNLKPTAAPIIGLSGKLGGARRQHHYPPAIFPKKAKTGGGGRAHKAAVPEPGSPKVSCIGKVLSDRERARLGRPPRTRGSSRAPPGCCGGFGFLMRRSRSRNSAVECVDQSPPPPSSLPPLAEAARRRETKEVEEEDEVPAEAVPGLGGMRRFASGRRAAEWAAEMEDDGRVARSGPL